MLSLNYMLFYLSSNFGSYSQIIHSDIYIDVA